MSWPVLDQQAGYSHKTRIRAYKPAIDSAYRALADQDKGIFVQVVAKELWSRKDSRKMKEKLVEHLSDIGWTVTDDGRLETQDALLSEQFFPAGSQYDAYVAIRDILRKAAQKISIVDPFMADWLFATLGAIGPETLSIQLLTTTKNLKSDFAIEMTKFRQQHSGIAVEVRTTTDFHDRFIAIDESEYYHVGASMKDAGKRAFLISRLQDEPVISSLKQYITDVWLSAEPCPVTLPLR